MSPFSTSMTGCPASGRNHSARLPKASHFEGLVQKQESLEILVVLGFQGFLAALRRQTGCRGLDPCQTGLLAGGAFAPYIRAQRELCRANSFRPSILISYGIHKNTHTILVWVFLCPNAINRLFWQTVFPIKSHPSTAVVIWKESQNECALTFEKSRSKLYIACSDLVRLKGLEPTRIAAREPKSRMSTNSITGAYSISLCSPP